MLKLGGLRDTLASAVVRPSGRLQKRAFDLSALAGNADDILPMIPHLRMGAQHAATQFNAGYTAQQQALRQQARNRIQTLDGRSLQVAAPAPVQQAATKLMGGRRGYGMNLDSWSTARPMQAAARPAYTPPPPVIERVGAAAAKSPVVSGAVAGGKSIAGTAATGWQRFAANVSKWMRLR